MKCSLTLASSTSPFTYSASTSCRRCRYSSTVSANTSYVVRKRETGERPAASWHLPGRGEEEQIGVLDVEEILLRGGKNRGHIRLVRVLGDLSQEELHHRPRLITRVVLLDQHLPGETAA